MTDLAERLLAAGAVLPLTTCVFMTINEDGTVTSVGHGPIGPDQRRVIEAIAGPPIAAQLLTEAEVATAQAIELGMTVDLSGGAP